MNSKRETFNTVINVRASEVITSAESSQLFTGLREDTPKTCVSTHYTNLSC